MKTAEAALARAKFAQAYLTNGRNATQAAMTAGYSRKTAASQGGRLLKHVEVQQLIQQPVQQAIEKVEVKTAEVVAETGGLLERLVTELAHIALLDPKDFYDATGKLLSLHEMPEHARRAIATFEAESWHAEETNLVTVTSKIKPNDKIRAIQVIAQLKALIPEKASVTNVQNNVVNVYRWRSEVE